MKQSQLETNQLCKDQLVHIGRILQEAREGQSLSLEAVAETTLIRPSLLRAIEGAVISELPEPVYTRGLIRRYGDSVGLDGEALSLQYFTPRHGEPKRSFWRVPITPQLRPVHLYLTYIMLIAIAISGLSYTLQRMNYRTSALPVLEGDAAEDATMPEGGPASDSDEQADESTTAALPPEVATSPIRVAVELRGQSWLRVTSDGQVEFEGILKEGHSQTWTAEEQLKIRAGNAGGVMVSFNEEPAKTLGQPGMVSEAIFPLESTARLRTSQP